MCAQVFPLEMQHQSNKNLTSCHASTALIFSRVQRFCWDCTSRVQPYSESMESGLLSSNQSHAASKNYLGVLIGLVYEPVYLVLQVLHLNCNNDMISISHIDMWLVWWLCLLNSFVELYKHYYVVVLTTLSVMILHDQLQPQVEISSLE